MDGPFGDDGGMLPPILAVKTDTRGRQLIANNGHRRSFARRRGRASACNDGDLDVFALNGQIVYAIAAGLPGAKLVQSNVGEGSVRDALA